MLIDISEDMKKWTLQQLIDAAKVSTVLRILSDNEVTRRAHEGLRGYVSDPSEFLDCLFTSASMISGSFALAMVNPRFSQHVNDVDVYASIYRYTNVVEHLTEKEGEFVSSERYSIMLI